MSLGLPRLVVAGGCPLHAAALGDWLSKHGVAESACGAGASAESVPVVLLLCSELDPSQEFTEVKSKHPSAQVLAVLSINSERVFSTLRSLNIRNVFCADEHPDNLSNAIQTMLSGSTYVSRAFGDFLARESADAANTLATSRPLTPRELEVLRLLAQGLSKKRIAESLFLSVKTVDNHCTSIMSKLNIHNRVDLARYAIREGLATA